MKLNSRKDYRQRRHLRTRKRLHGTAGRPRLSVMVSNRYMYVQFIDDDNGVTLVSASTVKSDDKNNVATARKLGKQAGEAAVKKGIKDVVVDRGGFKFHGRVKAIVDAVREAGVGPRPEPEEAK